MSEGTQRRLAAIVAADVTGYSRLVGADEEGTLQAFQAHRRELIEPAIDAHNGRIANTAGDSLLMEFSSVVDAVRCATAIQSGLAERNADVPEERKILMRIGINLGDVVADGDDLMGDGVNIAARLEALSDSGGIALSDDAYRQVRDRINIDWQDGGEHEVKNIIRPVHIWRWSAQEKQQPREMSTIDANPTPTEKPSIAVLPFDNMSGDPDQEYFADGLTEDIITALSKHRWLDVVARNSTFAYKGKSPDIREVAAALGADYVVEGSVRRSGERIRITTQLIDAGTGNHVWAERYDRKLEDIFDVQDEITETIVGRVEPEIGTAIRQKVQRAGRRNLHAWDCYHLGLTNFYKFTSEGNLEAQRLLQRSRELDPDFSDAHAWWAYSIILGMVYWNTEPSPELLDEALAAAQQALALDSQNAQHYMLLGRVKLARREYRSALADCEKAIQLNSTLAPAYCGLGDSLCYEGRYEESIAHFKKAVSMSPNHPQLWAFLTYGALAFLFQNEFEKALEWAERASDIPNCQYWTTAHAAVALAYLDRPKEAKRMVDELLVEQPDFTCSFAEKKLFYLKRPEQLALYLDGLAKAGVPAG